MSARPNIVREVQRCQRAVNDATLGFWIRRLTKWAELLEEDAAALRAEIARLESTRPRPTTDKGEEG